MSAEKPNSPITSPQTKLFDMSGEPTPESQRTNDIEMSPAEEFSQLTNGQKPINYGLDTDEKIRQFVQDNKGMSIQNVMFALTALTSALEQNGETTYSWQKRKDLQ